MQLLKILACLSVFFSASACKTWPSEGVCETSKSAAHAAASGMATALECSGVDAIKEDFESVVYKLNLCKEEERIQSLAVGDVICAPIANFIVDKGIDALPEEYGCKGGVAGAGGKDGLIRICKAALSQL